MTQKWTNSDRKFARSIKVALDEQSDLATDPVVRHRLGEYPSQAEQMASALVDANSTIDMLQRTVWHQAETISDLEQRAGSLNSGIEYGRFREACLWLSWGAALVFALWLGNEHMRCLPQ